MMLNKEDSREIYVTVKQLVSDPHFCFSEPALRYYILHSGSNGLKFAIRRLGRKILIRRDLFVNWLEEQGQKRAR